MPITPEQRERRRNHIGASDVPAILGMSPFKSAYDVFLEKTQRMDQVSSEAIDIGNRLEPYVLDWAEEQLGPLIRNVELISPERDFMGANLDATTEEKQVPVEAKTSGLLWKLDDKWGDDGSDQVPDYISVQAYAQMFVAQKTTCFIPAFLGGRGFSMFTIERNETTMKMIIDACEEFWFKNVLTNTPPADSRPHLEVVKRIQREDLPETDIAEEIVQRWLEAKEAAKIANEAVEQSEASVIAALGSGESAKCRLGIVNYKSQDRASYTVKACSYRVLRLQKPKKATR